jgi:hypothetical protein
MSTALSSGWVLVMGVKYGISLEGSKVEVACCPKG